MFSSMEAMECLPGVMRARLSDSDNPNLQDGNWHSRHDVAACASGAELAMKKRGKKKMEGARGRLRTLPSAGLPPVATQCDRILRSSVASFNHDSGFAGQTREA